MTSQEARDLMIRNKITYLDIDAKALVRLGDCLVAEFAAFHGIKMDLLPLRYRVNSDEGIAYAFYEVRGSYFDCRPAISFEKTGFVSFAPWADDQTIVPIMAAFERWITWMSTRSRSSATSTRKREFESPVPAMVNT
ncbi:MAG: hypothetical protein WC509_02090 [Candidatus Izemoplasmatales bacterium]